MKGNEVAGLTMQPTSSAAPARVALAVFQVVLMLQTMHKANNHDKIRKVGIRFLQQTTVANIALFSYLLAMKSSQWRKWKKAACSGTWRLATYVTVTQMYICEQILAKKYDAHRKVRHAK